MGVVTSDEFADLIRQNSRLLHKIARAYCRNAEDRDDVVQEIVVQMWRSMDRYDPKFARSTWIYRIALNVAISFYRRERRHKANRQSGTEHLLAVPEDHDSNEEIETLHHCIDELDALNKALVLLYLEGHDHASIADILGISATNVSTKLGRIKQELRRAFEARAATTTEKSSDAT